MNDYEKFNEASLPEKEDFYRYFNTEDITDVNYKHAKVVCKDFQIKNIGEYHNSYVPSDTLLLADVFNKFQKMS